jgi:chromosome segregation ATPase
VNFKRDRGITWLRNRARTGVLSPQFPVPATHPLHRLLQLHDTPHTATMPGLVQRGRKRPSRVLSDDDENEQSDPSSSVSVGSKRARRARDASPSQDRANGNRRHDHASEASVEEVFQPGTLVRVKLKNFVTYTAAEFHLGPSLNMIIGPNGTGKSTLVCAICLGLGWSPELLGRAKDIALFVKNGSDVAEIEIELAAGPGMATNPIVTREIRKKDSKTRFWINGQSVGKNAVLALCKQFSIQIDNLCQFLPQDRVVEFAKMQDVDRLRETQRAAAPKHMVEWHDKLKDLRTEEKGLEIKQQAEKSHLEVLEKQQNADREDVERFQQREGLLLKAKCLEKVRPIIALAQLKSDVVQAKKDLQSARRELDLLNANVEPVRQAQDEVETYKNQIEEVVKLRKNRLDLLKAHADKLFSKLEKDKQNVIDFTDQISGEANSKKLRDRDIARLKSEIQRLERQRQDQPVGYDAGSFEARKADLSAQGRIASSRLLELETAYNTLSQSIRDLGVEYGSVQEQRKRLDTQSGKQASALRNLSSDTAKAWEWFRQHRNELPLKGEVYGPPILVCSIRDPRYADAVESQLRKGDLLAITFTNGDDQKLLSDYLLGTGENRLGLHDVHLRTSKNPLSNYQPPVPPARLQDFGFEGYVVDYVEGPDAVLAMLCDSVRLNRVAYAARPITDEQHAAASSSAIQKWVSGRDVVQITTRREYGASSTVVTQLKSARHFVNQPANSEEMRQLDEASTRIKRDNLEYKEEMAKVREEKSTYDEQLQEIRQAKEEIQVEQDRLKRAVAEWEALPHKIRRKQNDLDLLVQDNTKTSSRIREIKSKSQEASLDVAVLTLEYAVSVHVRCVLISMLMCPDNSNPSTHLP